MRWAMRKYKRLRGHRTRTARFLAAVAERERGLFAHWGIARRRLDDNSRVSREGHAGICERRGVRLPPGDSTSTAGRATTETVDAVRHR